MNTSKPVVLCILDGWGQSLETASNAPALARTPNFDRLMTECPNAKLLTHGNDAGLPTGQMGNSEVGHTNIGAGRVVAMDLGQIDLSIEDGSFFDNAALQDFIAKLKTSKGTAHVMGLASDGGVHGHVTHIKAAIKAITNAGVPVAFHAMTDGRDVAPKSAMKYMADLCGNLPDGARIATVSGRYYAMDRDNRWERVATAYNAIVHADAPESEDIGSLISKSYRDGITDEFFPATILNGYDGMKDGDGLFCLNFRSDRAREILRAIGEPNFEAFDVGDRPNLTTLLGMVEYSDNHSTYMTTAFPKRVIPNTLGEWVSKHGKTQFRLAETEKYPHVTFFLNGGVETPYPLEDRFMPASPKVATYDLQPEMSAPEVTEKFVEAVHKGYDLIITNFANPDMVGHTGDLHAAILACEAVDQGLGQVMKALDEVGGTMIVTADHGNCDLMVDPISGGPHTAHTTNPVPVALYGGAKSQQLRDGRLADLAPSLLQLMDLEKPEEMTGESLIF
ncbi:2,3-bisphosphoglycerate-independent phosphoglycerate mutase [Halocynthiibacter namhaensis]|uniref:2,3-bisphosphoglycerate-independent phosphoglycerate mutase n=1 Tax=Halocynthiibacter namhaensis TaxID=1290553 RepID=UPI0005790730|nr:2,3-bisphosphoglycerate-independent phosphoglycerate mutase [Halocynthiibacter namhaensis]